MKHSSKHPVFVAALLFFAFSFVACNSELEERELPIYGKKDLVIRVVDGKEVQVEEPLPYSEFSFTDQEGRTFTQDDVLGKVHVADFFFTSCPTICPKMKQQMLRVHDAFSHEKQLVIVSHSIDPRHDSVAVLKNYAQKLEIDSDQWHLVVGEKAFTYELAGEYMIHAAEDATAPGGFVHSGAFILFDQKRRIRGFYDGTEAEDVDRLMEDITLLLAEK